MPFCTQCGYQVMETDAFCANCGKPQASHSSTPPPPPPPPAPDPLAGLSPRTASILCYIPTVGWIAAVVVLAARKFRGEKIVRFHAFQGLYLFAVWLMVQWVVHPIVSAMPDHTIRVDRLLEGILLAVSIFMIIKASHGEPYVLPIIGELAQKSAAEQ
ncbi:MAG TPA: hypothetical protein VHB50_15675 [Bryobacteraceae bacterium]|nr:hypothetical protein [Bryobacteraceae bacterium]